MHQKKPKYRISKDKIKELPDKQGYWHPLKAFEFVPQPKISKNLPNFTTYFYSTNSVFPMRIRSLANLIAVIFMLSGLWACRTTPTCDDEGSTKYGNQEFNVVFVRLDSVNCPPDTCIVKDVVLGSFKQPSYNATLITVLLDTTGNTGSNIIFEQPNSFCDNGLRKCGPYRFGTEDRVVGRDYNFVYSFIHNQTQMMGRVKVNFQMRADGCKTFFGKVNYYFNNTLLPEYSLNPKASIECYLAPTRFN